MSNVSKKMLMAAAGAAGGAGLDVDEVFSCHLYNGNGSSQAIENNINLGTWAAENTVLHLTGDSLNDSSPFSHTVTAVGNTSVNTTTKKYGTGSIYFDGSGDYLRTSSGTYVLGTTDFTLEFWAYYADASTTKGIFHLWDGSTLSNYSLALYHASNDYTFNFKNGVDGTPSATINSSGDVITNSTWHHVAIVRYNNTLKLYVNGTAVTSGTDVSGYNFVMDDLEIGTHWDSSYTFTGYIDDWRITNGSARYTGNFTPPNAALPLDTTVTGEGGAVWLKRRDGTGSHAIFDTVRGRAYNIQPSGTDPQDTFSSTTGLTSFNSNGFSLGSPNYGSTNTNNADYVSWTFRKAEKFFDVVTWTGDGTASRNISHNLKSVPGHVMVKKISGGSAAGWINWHRTFSNYQSIFLNTTELLYNPGNINSGVFGLASGFTSTHFQLGGTNNITYHNENNSTYVAYLFAHNNNDGEFGPDQDEDIIKCGSVTTNGSGVASVNLGFETQWLMYKKSSGSGSWVMYDNMRGLATTGSNIGAILYADGNYATLSTSAGDAKATATGIDFSTGENNTTYIYMAIRKGSLNVPDDATKVFHVNQQNNADTFSVGFPADLAIVAKTGGSSSNSVVGSRLTGDDKFLVTSGTDAEATSSSIFTFDLQNSFKQGFSTSAENVSWMWKRAPSYFDVVATVTSSAQINHNLGVTPELAFYFNRSGDNINVFAPTDGGLFLNSDARSYGYGNGSYIDKSFGANATATTVSSGGGALGNNINVLIYLFASLSGVSKIGGVVHSGTTNVDAGFSSGSRFVLVKRVDGVGDWLTWDGARGIVSNNDPYLALNSAAAEVTNTDYIDPYSAGFTLTSNLTSGTYLYYAIA